MERGTWLMSFNKTLRPPREVSQILVFRPFKFFMSLQVKGLEVVVQEFRFSMTRHKRRFSDL